MKRAFLCLAFTAAVLLVTSGAHAADSVRGTWAFSATGGCDLPSTSSSSCQSGGNNVATSLYNGEITFTPGTTNTLTIKFLLNIGSKNCSKYYFSGRGTYQVPLDKGGVFQATGTFSALPSANYTGACSKITLTGVNFTMQGDSLSTTFTINGFSPNGSGTYAEGGPSYCTTQILNIVAKGSAYKL